MYIIDLIGNLKIILITLTGKNIVKKLSISNTIKLTSYHFDHIYFALTILNCCHMFVSHQPDYLFIVFGNIK